MRGMAITRITLAAVLFAFTTLFIFWLEPRWALLDHVDQTAAVFAIALLVIAALGCLICGGRRS